MPVVKIETTNKKVFGSIHSRGTPPRDNCMGSKGQPITAAQLFNTTLTGNTAPFGI